MFDKKRILFIPLLLIAFCFMNNVFAAPKSVEKVLNIEYWQTNNGTRVYFVKAPELPTLDILMAFDAGSARDDNQLGIAALTQSMLTEGTKQKNADQIANDFEKVGAIFDTDLDRDMVTISLRTLTQPKYLNPAVDSLADVVSHPAFKMTALKHVKEQIKTTINLKQQSPAEVATDHFYKNLFGNHPYANPILGTIESINKITAEDLEHFHKQYYVAHNLVIVMVGNIDRREAAKIAEKVTQPLKEGSAAAPLPALNRTVALQKEILSFTSTQAAIRLGQYGVNREAKDYFPLIVANYILGGSTFTSRLNQEVREKNGLTYAIFSYFEPLRARGPFLITLETRQEAADKAVRLIDQVLKKYLQDGPTATELNDAKKNLIGGFALHLDSNKAIANNVLVIGFYHLPLDYLDHYREKINAVTVQDIRDSLRKHLNPDEMVLVQTKSS